MPAAIVAIGSFLGEMGTVVALGIGASAAGAAAFGAAVGVFFVNASIVYALNRAMKALAPKPPKYDRQTAGIETAYQGTLEPQRTLIGQLRVGGMDVLPRWSTGTKGEYLHITQAIAGHECESITDVYFNTDTIATADIGAVSGTTSDGLVSGSSGYASHAWIRRILGTSTDTVDYILSTTFPSVITSDFRGRGIAKVATQLKYNTDVYKDGIPNISYKVKGKKLYDPRTGTTVWSANPALALRDYLTNAVSGLGADTSEIDDTSCIAAANICDQLVNLPAAATQARYTCNGVYYANQDKREIITQLSEAMLGRCVYRSGKWYMYAGAWDAPVVALSSEDWVGSDLTIRTVPDREDRYNFVRCFYVDPARNYQKVECLPQQNATYESQDGGERIQVELDQVFCNNEYEAQRKAKLFLRQSRNAVTIAGTLRPKFAGLAIWETVTLTMSEYGFSSKTFRVIACDLNLDGSLGVILREESSADWSDPATSDYDSPFTSPGTPSESVNVTSPTGIYVPTTDAETAAGVTPASFFYREGDIRRYGAVVDGTTSDYTAIQTAITVAQAAAGVGEVYIPGDAAVASASLPLNITASGVNFIGVDRYKSRIIVTGTSDNNLIRAQDCSDISWRNIGFYGNNQASGYIKGWAIDIRQTGSTVMQNFVVEECHFENFKGDYWVCVYVSTGTAAIENIWIHDNSFKSQSGNCRGPASTVISSSCIAFIGSTTNSTGLIRNAWVHDNSADCYYIKSFVNTWACSENVFVRGNNILNCGADAGISNGCGADAIIAYDQSAGVTLRPDRVYVENNYIYNSREAGFYSAKANRVFCRNNTVSGQTNTDNSAIPKGAFALNQPLYAVVEGNRIEDCAFGVNFVPDVSGGVVEVLNNSFSALKSSSTAIYGAAGAPTGQAVRATIRGNKINSSASGHGIYYILSSATGVRDIDISDNEILTGSYGIYIDKSAGFYCDQLNISGNRFYGQASQVCLLNAITTPKVLIQDNQFLGGWGGGATLLYLASCTKLVVRDNTFCNLTSGYALYTTGAQGSIGGTRFSGVAASYQYYTSAGEELGVDTPTWTGAAGDMIQNLAASHQTSPYDHFVVGWMWDAGGSAWKQLRNPTGTISGGSPSDGDKGDVVVSSSGAVWTIDSDVVTFAKMQDIATQTFLGRTTAGTGDPEALTATQATALLDAFTATAKGLANAPGSGNNDLWKVLTGANSFRNFGKFRFKQDANTTLELEDNWGVVRIGNLTSNRQVTIPTNASVAFPYPDVGLGTDLESEAAVVLVLWYGSGSYTLTVHPDTGVTLRYPTGLSTATTGDWVSSSGSGLYLMILVKVAINTWYGYPIPAY